jgi:hypothetical protein
MVTGNAWYSGLGLLAGVLFLIVALICMLHRYTGGATMRVEFLEFRAEIKTSVPGLVFALLGLLVISLTR